MIFYGVRSVVVLKLLFPTKSHIWLSCLKWAASALLLEGSRKPAYTKNGIDTGEYHYKSALELVEIIWCHGSLIIIRH